LLSGIGKSVVLEDVCFCESGSRSKSHRHLHTLMQEEAVGVPEGASFTTTVVDAVEEHPASVTTVTVYNPALANVAEAIVGVADEDVETIRTCPGI
jgi:hypothetical protein